MAADYVIGDVQGCYAALQRLLELVEYNEHDDQLWFVGDLVNRGPDSLSVLRWIHQQPRAPHVTLGNHDLHLLQLLFCEHPRRYPDDTLDEILIAPDREELGHWLRSLPFLFHDQELNVVMSHAGIAPLWTLEQAKTYAAELSACLAGPDYIYFLSHMYVGSHDVWSENMTHIARLRLACHYLTRMRFCYANGDLVWGYKGSIAQAPEGVYPWYALPYRQEIPADLVFGHWSALLGECPHPRIHALDTGCVWGGTLTALRLQDYQRFMVDGK